jgi:hypothetical protein
MKTTTGWESPNTGVTNVNRCSYHQGGLQILDHISFGTIRIIGLRRGSTEARTISA